MKDKVGIPTFAPTKDQFDPVTLNQMQRSLTRFFNELLTSGPCSITELTLTDTPTSSSGLRDDVVFVDNGYLKLSGQSQANAYKAGSATILTGNTTQAVTFNTAFSDNNYAVTLGDDDNQFVWITSKSASGFTLNRVGSGNDEEVWWIAFPFSDL